MDNKRKPTKVDVFILKFNLENDLMFHPQKASKF